MVVTRKKRMEATVCGIGATEWQQQRRQQRMAKVDRRSDFWSTSQAKQQLWWVHWNARKKFGVCAEIFRMKNFSEQFRNGNKVDHRKKDRCVEDWCSYGREREREREVWKRGGRPMVVNDCLCVWDDRNGGGCLLSTV